MVPMVTMIGLQVEIIYYLLIINGHSFLDHSELFIDPNRNDHACAYAQ